MTRARLAGFGYAYVGLALAAFAIDKNHPHVASPVFTGAAFAYLWFLASLRARLVRFDPDGFFASVVVLGGAALIALQAISLLVAKPEFAGPASACAATVIVGSSLAALRARKVSRPFGVAGVLGGLAVLAVGMVEGATGWVLSGTEIYASLLGFMVWVVVTSAYLLRR